MTGRLALALLASAALTTGAAWGQDGHEHHAGHDPHAHHAAQTPLATAPGAATVALRDLPLVDRNGRRVRLVSDVLDGRVAVISFVYTTCTTVCPVTSATFARLQSELGERLGREVVLVSITVDPLRDTPARLKRYAAQHGAGEGWMWLTGAKADLDAVLKGMGAYTPNYQDHPAMVLVGDARRGEWKRYFGFPSVKELRASVDALGGQQHASMTETKE